MKIGIGLPNQIRDVDPELLPTWAARAEHAGFATLSTVGRIAYPGVQDTVALAAAAGATGTIGLLSGVMLPTVWPAVLLAKEVAAIDGVSGGRLTLGAGIGGNRADDYVVEGLPGRQLGARMDADLETYHRVWRGEPVGGGSSPAVPAGTRPVPMVFGGTAPKALRRMAEWGAGYIAGPVPATMVTPMFDAARDAWREGGRTGSPRLIALAYYALDDIERARANAGDYYAASGTDTATLVLDTMSHTPAAIRAVITSFAGIGASELVFMPATDDIAEIDRLAEIAL